MTSCRTHKKQLVYVAKDDTFLLALSLCLENNSLRLELQPSRFRAISMARNCIRGTTTNSSDMY